MKLNLKQMMMRMRMQMRMTILEVKAKIVVKPDENPDVTWDEKHVNGDH
jgi:hypothetical protein